MPILSDSLRAGGKVRGSLAVTAREATNVPIDITTHASQSVPALRVRNSAGTTLLSLDVNGDLTVLGTTTTADTTTSDDFSVTDALTVGGTATFNGNVLVGDASSDTLTVNSTSSFLGSSSFTGNVAFTNATGQNFTTNVLNVTGSATLSGADLVTTTGTQTLTNKTLTSPAVTTSLTTGSTTFALLNTTATTVNAFGAATTLNIGASATCILNFGGSTTASEFRFLEPSGSGTNYSAFKAVAQAASITYSLPPSVLAAGFLTDAVGDGVLTWSAIQSASTTVSGIAEASIASEVDIGTDAARYVSPDSLAGSNLGTKVLETVAVDFTTDTTVANGLGYIVVPACMAGMDLVAAEATVITAGTTNTTDVKVYNLTQAAHMLSTAITINSGATQASDGVIDTANDDVAAYDVLRIDVTAISTTAAKGLLVVLEFRLP